MCYCGIIMDYTAKQELLDLRQKFGVDLRPSHIVAHAVDPASALHSEFTWDDSAAAASYRLIEAQNLLKIVVRHEKIEVDLIRAKIRASSGPVTDWLKPTQRTSPSVVEAFPIANARTITPQPVAAFHSEAQALHALIRDLDMLERRYTNFDNLVRMIGVFMTVARKRLPSAEMVVPETAMAAAFAAAKPAARTTV